MAAVFNLNHHASFVHWHFFQMSVSNILVIAAMFVVFFAAIFIRFPRHREDTDLTGKESP
jgi:uncharacterized BrkB/YihY/UPF0761 family membrane protein